MQYPKYGSKKSKGCWSSSRVFFYSKWHLIRRTGPRGLSAVPRIRSWAIAILIPIPSLVIFNSASYVLGISSLQSVDYVRKDLEVIAGKNGSPRGYALMGQNSSSMGGHTFDLSWTTTFYGQAEQAPISKQSLRHFNSAARSTHTGFTIGLKWTMDCASSPAIEARIYSPSTLSRTLMHAQAIEKALVCIPTSCIYHTNGLLGDPPIRSIFSLSIRTIDSL
ncbi:hypothetical protein K469DRAFT_255575 [Zopfia rhizophila CBS 207.26]|uniref:Uncharacterized protein n=1 Tax=Zopfia rhizophila CBS 207.26 TaxID=1314779 RepID=A0A6A6DVI6_9PEZI|nr:hypothetical protein K469DRAFT_255575 [Zopfia rhizophila CBS 207.26]